MKYRQDSRRNGPGSEYTVGSPVGTNSNAAVVNPLRSTGSVTLTWTARCMPSEGIHIVHSGSRGIVRRRLPG